MRPAFPSSGAGTGIDFVRNDDANELIEKNFSLGRCKRREHAILPGPRCRLQALIEFCACRCETQLPRATIIAIDAALDEPRHDQLVDQ
jgi:hypothetical protein